MKRVLTFLSVTAILLLSGCAKQTPYDYAAFHESKPKSILVLPPVNQSPDVKASHSVLASTTLPLAEAGHYVLPTTSAPSVRKNCTRFSAPTPCCTWMSRNTVPATW